MQITIINVCTENPKKILDIDKQLILNGNQLIYYSSAYLMFLKCISPKSSFYYISVFDNQKLIGIMPLSVLKQNGFTIINSMPFYGSYGGPIVFQKENREDITRKILKKLQEFSKDINARIVNFIENPLNPICIENIKELGFEKIDERIGQVTIFPCNQPDVEQALMSLFHSKTRNMVRKGEKTDLIIELRHDDASYEWLHSEHTKSITKLGGLAKPIEAFNSLRTTFGEDCKLYIGYIKEQPVCGVLLLVYAQTIEYFTPVVKEEFRECQALSFLIYNIMINMIRNGYRQWNWGGTWISQEGVYRFKKRWGSDDFRYGYYSKIGLDITSLPPIDHLRNDFPYYYLYNY